MTGDTPAHANARRILRILESDLDHPTTVEEWGEKLSLPMPDLLEALSLLTAEGTPVPGVGSVTRREPGDDPGEVGTYWQGRMLDTRRDPAAPLDEVARAAMRAQSHLPYDPATGQAVRPPGERGRTLLPGEPGMPSHAPDCPCPVCRDRRRGSDPLARIAGALERIAETLASVDRRLGRDDPLRDIKRPHEGGRGEQRVRS